ncbi:MAG: hypothetical protein LBQ63_01480 [Deltaproteobacteria bacterium]|jgi:hypothetical protein|nr:hypothetical protein [Deltaproteobacteria bacterium]
MWPFKPAWQSNNIARAIRAIEKLNDQKTLAGIAENGMNDAVRRAAIQRLTDQKTLARIAWNYRAGLDRNVAVLNLTDQDALADIAKDEDSSLGVPAIVFNDVHIDVRIKAAGRLNDQKVLLDIINDPLIDKRLIPSMPRNR